MFKHLVGSAKSTLPLLLFLVFQHPWATAATQLGDLKGEAILGQSLNLEVPLTGEESSLTQLHSSCIKAIVSDGSNSISSNSFSQELLVSLKAGQSGQRLIQVRGNRAFNFPLGNLRMQITCPLLNLEKSWMLLAEKSTERATHSPKPELQTTEIGKPKDFSIKLSEIIEPQSPPQRADTRLSSTLGRQDPIQDRQKFTPRETADRLNRPLDSEQLHRNQDSNAKGPEYASLKSSQSAFENADRTMMGINEPEPETVKVNAGNRESIESLNNSEPNSSFAPKPDLYRSQAATDYENQIIWGALLVLIGLTLLTIYAGYRWLRKRRVSNANFSTVPSKTTMTIDEENTDESHQNKSQQFSKKLLPEERNLIFESLLGDEDRQGESFEERNTVGSTALSQEVCDVLKIISGAQGRAWTLSNSLMPIVREHSKEFAVQDAMSVSLNECNLAMIELSAKKALSNESVYQPEVDLILGCLRISHEKDDLTENLVGFSDLIKSFLNAKNCEFPDEVKFERFKQNLNDLSKLTAKTPLCFSSIEWIDYIANMRTMTA